jgi:putative PIN family toxin of toxin-antitoxin system
MPKSRPSKIIIDTNLWISFIISNKLSLLDSLIFSGKIRLIFSLELIKEIEATIAKPKLKKYFLSDGLVEMLTMFEPFINLVEVKSVVSVCRDPKDNFLLELAKDSKADYILTGDKDLLAIAKFGKTKIMTVTSFLESRNKM